MAETDAVLVEKSLEGDNESFKLLFERYGKRAYAVSYGILQNSEDAKDAIQNSFIRAFRSLHRFRKASSFYTWLYRIVVNASIDLSRKRRRTPETIPFEEGIQNSSTRLSSEKGSFADPSNICRQTELSDTIQKAMEGLSVEHKAVITLREIEGLSYAEISQSLECSIGTVMSRLYYARKHMKTYLEDYYKS
ncbi:MAG: sigma-70 family RNA polymerase sigma factor [Candidatus Theseobacter exili]|nr:sigma-70 family RNA polymerase sigma factor [Candidatus Theseobacter exili]